MPRKPEGFGNRSELSCLARGFIAGAAFGAGNPDYTVAESLEAFKKWVAAADEAERIRKFIDETKRDDDP